MRFAAEHLKLIIEPGGAVALAAILAGPFANQNLTIAITLSGGNADPAG
jgi:threonine dehydratase